MKRTYIADTPSHVGEEVTIRGWVHTKRDHGKILFLDIRDETGVIQSVLASKNVEEIKEESVVEVTGVVAARPASATNSDVATGGIEMKIGTLTLLARAETPPIPVQSEGYEIGEEKRLRYRYLDLRRPRLQRNIRMRGRVISFLRRELIEGGFVEIETPLLTRSTPEGARDFIVPSRLSPGTFYALPQSPQQYKQLLQVAGFERYFQIARALRDEDPRGDRQAEHTQLDIEMSFTTPEEVMSLIEKITTAMVKELFPSKKVASPWPRISYRESMEKYGNDKPDVRSRKDDPDEVAFAWIIDFPSFELNKEKKIQPVHHMFVKPTEESVDLLDTDPLKMTSTQYDWVCNGYELASGSMRITDPDLQMKVFTLLGMEEEKARKDFGHLLEAFTYGVPPHGGIAPGIDRLLMILLNEPNIREVMAFPKTGDNRDLMMDAPAPVSQEQLEELHLTLKKPRHDTA